MIELCAGGGGASLGLERAGFDPVMLIERESNACATLRLNRPSWPVIKGDVRQVDFDQFVPGEIDLLSGKAYRAPLIRLQVCSVAQMMTVTYSLICSTS